MFGFRPDGRRVKGIEPLVRITPYLMPTRVDAMVFLQHRLDFEALSRYIAAQNLKGEKVTFMQIIAASFIRAISEHPEINRYILNKQFFSRNNCTISFNILRDPNNADAGETAVKIKFDLTDTLYDVRDRMNAVVNVNRGVGTENFVDKLINAVTAVPGVVTVVVALVRLLDRYGLCPGALLDELPFHTSLYMTNNSSIGLHHVNHHIYNFGSTNLFVAMGSVERIATVEDGKTRMKRWLPIGITADERVCSGAHYSGFFASACHYFNHPEELEVPPKEVHFDPHCEYHVPKLAEQQAAKAAKEAKKRKA